MRRAIRYEPTHPDYAPTIAAHLKALNSNAWVERMGGITFVVGRFSDVQLRVATDAARETRQEPVSQEETNNALCDRAN